MTEQLAAQICRGLGNRGWIRFGAGGFGGLGHSADYGRADDGAVSDAG
jgi:hypothetical protein